MSGYPTDVFPQEIWDQLVDLAAANDVDTAAAIRLAHPIFHRAIDHLYHWLVLDWRNGCDVGPVSSATHLLTNPFRAHNWFRRHPHLGLLVRRLRLQGSPSNKLADETLLDMFNTFPNVDELTIISIQTSHVPLPRPYPHLRRLCLGYQALPYTCWLVFETRFANSLQSLAFRADNTQTWMVNPKLTPPAFPLVTHIDVALPSGSPRPVTFPHLPAVKSMTLTAYRPSINSSTIHDCDDPFFQAHGFPSNYVWQTAWSTPFVALTALCSLHVIVGASDILGAARTIHSISPGRLTDLTIEYQWDHYPRRHGAMTWSTCCLLQRVKRNLLGHLEHAAFNRLRIVFGLHSDVTYNGSVFRQWVETRLEELRAIFSHSKASVTLQPGVYRYYHPDTEEFQRRWEIQNEHLKLTLQRRGRKHGVSVFSVAHQFKGDWRDDSL